MLFTHIILDTWPTLLASKFLMAICTHLHLHPTRKNSPALYQFDILGSLQNMERVEFITCITTGVTAGFDSGFV